MKLRLTESEKNSIRELHEQNSKIKKVVKEQLDNVKVPKICLDCVTNSLKGSGDLFGFPIQYDYTLLATKVAMKIFEIYSEDPDNVSMEDIEEVLGMLSEVEPQHIILIAPQLMNCAKKCAINTATDYVLGVD